MATSSSAGCARSAFGSVMPIFHPQIARRLAPLTGVQGEKKQEGKGQGDKSSLCQSPGNAETVKVVAEARVAVVAVRTPEEAGGGGGVPRAPTQHTGRRCIHGCCDVATLVSRVRLSLICVCAPLPHVTAHLVMAPGTASLRMTPHAARHLAA